jgi:hypothetical protein
MGLRTAAAYYQAFGVVNITTPVYQLYTRMAVSTCINKLIRAIVKEKARLPPLAYLTAKPDI